MLPQRTQWLACVFASILCNATFAADSADERFLDGLRARRLFTLAESYCHKRLEDPKLGESQRAEIVVELSRCCTDHALHSPPGASTDALWQQASAVPLDFARRFPNSPWLILVKTQSALVVLSRGEFSRQQSEVSGNQQKLLDEARVYLRTAARQLAEVSDELAARLRETIRPSSEPALTRDQLLSLQRSLRYQHSRAMRNLGQSHPPDSPDRTSALAQAVEALTPLTQLSTADPLCWQSRLDEITCERMLKDFPAAHRRLAQLSQLDPPPVVVLRARAEQIRLSLAVGRIEESIALLETGRDLGGLKQPELDLAFLETYLAAWRAAIDAKDKVQTKHWEGQTSAMIVEMARLHGNYWRRRAESLLSGQVTAAAPVGETDVLVRAAEGHFRNGQFDDAVKVYDRAAALAAENKNPIQAFQFSFTAAAIEHERKQHRAALDRYRRLALSQPRHERAAEAHHLAIYHASQEAKRIPGGSLAEYASLLDEHLRTWPTGVSADQAHWLLGRLREHEGDLPAAIAEYQRLAVDHPQFLPALEAQAGCYQRWLSDLKSNSQRSREAVTAGTRYFEGLFVASEGRLPERWSPVQRAAALAAARLWLLDTPPRYDRAEVMLSAALADAANFEGAWKPAAAGMLVSALAGQGRLEEARRRLNEISGGSAADLLALAEGLSQIAAGRSREPSGTLSPERRDLAELVSHACGLAAARRAELDARGQMSLDRMQARGFAAAGKLHEARQLYEQLAKQNPRDGDLQEEYAMALSELQEKSALETALDKWRELEQKSKPATPRWFRAKYHLALMHERLGNKPHAAKIVMLTQVLHPDLGGTEMKAKFQALLARCQR